jgi:cell division protein FtsN
VNSDLPEKPETQWKYIKKLESYQSYAPIPNSDNKTIEIEQSRGLDKNHRVQDNKKQEIVQEWGVQCGPFKKLNTAQSVRATLALGGFESKIYTQGNLSQVKTVLFKNQGNTSNVLDYMISENYLSCSSFSIKNSDIPR